MILGDECCADGRTGRSRTKKLLRPPACKEDVHVGLKRLAHVRLMSGYIGGVQPASDGTLELVWRAVFRDPQFQGLHFILAVEVYIILETVCFLDRSGEYAAECT